MKQVSNLKKIGNNFKVRMKLFLIISNILIIQADHMESWFKKCQKCNVAFTGTMHAHVQTEEHERKRKTNKDEIWCNSMIDEVIAELDEKQKIKARKEVLKASKDIVSEFDKQLNANLEIQQ